MISLHAVYMITVLWQHECFQVIIKAAIVSSICDWWRSGAMFYSCVILLQCQFYSMLRPVHGLFTLAVSLSLSLYVYQSVRCVFMQVFWRWVWVMSQVMTCRGGRAGGRLAAVSHHHAWPINVTITTKNLANDVQCQLQYPVNHFITFTFTGLGLPASSTVSLTQH